MLAVIAIATLCSTLLGGLFALRLKDRLHLILGFSAGAVVGVAFFDLIPEALSVSSSEHTPMFVFSVIAVGFVLYLLLDRTLRMHGHDEGAHEARGAFGAGSLSVHSLLDGVGIGLAFQASPAVGLIVAVAVLTHDFSDGINTVSIVLRNGGDVMRAKRWLLVDALAPVLGILLSSLVTVPSGALAVLLSLFSGFFLYIGASDLLPESHHAHPVFWTTCSTIIGMLVIYAAVCLAGI
jgi:ZIP family zinc transporter